MGFIILFKMLFDLIIKIVGVIILLIILSILSIPTLFIYLVLGPHYVDKYFDKTSFIFTNAVDLLDHIAEKIGVEV